jgi:signal transduction histidine kinase
MIFAPDLRAEYPMGLQSLPDSTANALSAVAGSAVDERVKALLSLSCTAAPMRVQGRVVGVLSVTGPISQPFNTEEMSLLSSMADHLGLAIENNRLHAQAQRMAVIEERSHLARELHDSITQMLYSATLFANGARQFAEQGKLETTSAYLQQLESLMQQALREMRLLVFQLRPSTLEKSGLVAALERRLDSVERRAGVSARLQVDDPQDTLQLLPEETIGNLFHIAVEALNNALKHSKAIHIAVIVRIDDQQLTLSVQDDGQGIDLLRATRSGGLGLTTMYERSQEMSGVLCITNGRDSADGERPAESLAGACVTVTIPLVFTNSGR